MYFSFSGVFKVTSQRSIKKGWSFYLVSSSASGSGKSGINPVLFLLVLTFFCAGMVGFVRMSYFVGNYAYARFGLYDKGREHQNLNKKLIFLEKRLSLLKSSAQDFAQFEDLARIRLGLNEISEDIRLAGVGGVPSLKQIVEESFDQPSVKAARSLERDAESLLRQVRLQDSTFSRFAGYVNSQFDNWAQRPSIWPVRGRLTSGFGYRFHPLVGENLFHEGIDIANQTWTPVVATADGVAGFVGNNGNYGNVVKLNHNDGTYVTIYAHLQKAAVVSGQVVRRGELVGYLGSSGRSTGPHLHYEVRRFGRFVNPMDYILPSDIVVD